MDVFRNQSSFEYEENEAHLFVMRHKDPRKNFKKITNGESSKKARTPEEKEGKTSEAESENALKKQDDIVEMPNEKEFDSEDEDAIQTVHHEETIPQPNDKNIGRFDRFSEKASKYLSTRETFVKLFKDDKEADIKIYPIEINMAREKAAKINIYREEPYINLELTDRSHRIKTIQMEEHQPFKSVGCLANPYPPYRLYFLPSDDWNDPDGLLASIFRILMCLCTLACFLIVWLLMGSFTFYLTEGPYECDKIQEFVHKENSLIISFATDLQLLNPEESIWERTIEKYTEIHKNIILEGTSYRYGEQEVFWTFSGSLLFATSLLTTFGLATPLPMTTAGGVEAFIFALIGLPIHYIFLKHLGRLIALKTQLFAKKIENKLSYLRRRIRHVRRFGEDLPVEKDIWPDKMLFVDFKPSGWLKIFPVIFSIIYYIIGILVFGLARDMEWQRIIFFPVDFSRLDVSTSGCSRIGYAWYLEGVAILTFINLALFRDSPFKGLTQTGIRMGFMTNSLD